MTIVRDQGSFRDPAGYVAHYDGRVFRVLREDAFASFERLKSSGLLAELFARKWLVPTEVSSEPALGDLSAPRARASADRFHITIPMSGRSSF